MNKTAKKHSRYETARKALLFWTLFIGIGAVAGAVGMLSDTTGRAMGMDVILPYFQKLPFADVLFCDFLFSGLALLGVNGLPNLIAAALLLAKKRAGAVLGGVLGVTLMLWICIQFYMLPMNLLSAAYFIFGAAQAATGYAACVFCDQEHFSIDEAAYPNIGADPRLLVVFFSRMGYVKKAAFEEANRTGARLYEIRTAERTEGTLGFWWCGRFAMHRWDMPIAALPEGLEGYDHVTICTPVWAFNTAAPVRAFCRAAGGRIKAASYIILHHQKAAYQNVAGEMDALLGLKAQSVESVCCRRGRCTWRRELEDEAAQSEATAGKA